MEFAVALIVLAALLAALFALREPLAGFFALTPADIHALVVGGRADDKVSQLRKDVGDHRAFETLYAEDEDPWTSHGPRNGYQERKYDGIISFLPDHRFVSALDLGCGLGTFSRRLAARSDAVLGVDVAQSAIDRAAAQCRDVANLRFAQGDIFNLPAEMNGKFDLVMLVDTLYYAPVHTVEGFRTVADRIADLLMPGGLCVIANHYFVSDDPTILSRRIFAGFRQCPKLRFSTQRWRPFYRTVIFTTPRLPQP